MLSGKKTYIVAGAMITYNILGMFLGYMTPETGISNIMTALGLAALRKGVETSK